jgi:hypothetical protein
MIRVRVVVFVSLLLASVQIALAQGASESFAAAERAYAAGDFDEALRLFNAARASGSSGPGVLYNIGVSQFRLGVYDDAAATFAALAKDFPAMRDLAEYNRGLALRSAGRVQAARVAFARVRASSDGKIAALAAAQLAALDTPSEPASARTSPWSGYFAGALGHDDNVALTDAPLLVTGQSVSSPLAEALGVVTRRLTAPLRIDATGYWVRYSDADQYDQSALRLALVAGWGFGAWTLSAGPVLARSTLDGDGFEDIASIDLRARRDFGERMGFDVRVVYDDTEPGDARFAYVGGSRRQLRLGLQYGRAARVRVRYDLERNDRDDPGVSPSRERWSVGYQRRLSATWEADAALAWRVSRYQETSTPREEELTQVTLAARRDLRAGWSLNAEYAWSDNDSTVPLYSYDAQRVTVGVGRGF